MLEYIRSFASPNVFTIASISAFVLKSAIFPSGVSDFSPVVLNVRYVYSTVLCFWSSLLNDSINFFTSWINDAFSFLKLSTSPFDSNLKISSEAVKILSSFVTWSFFFCRCFFYSFTVWFFGLYSYITTTTTTINTII